MTLYHKSGSQYSCIIGKRQFCRIIFSELDCGGLIQIPLELLPLDQRPISVHNIEIFVGILVDQHTQFPFADVIVVYRWSYRSGSDKTKNRRKFFPYMDKICSGWVFVYRKQVVYRIISIPFCKVSASIAPVAWATAYPSASMKKVVGNEYAP